MVKKNVLIISYSYPPSNVPAAQRPYTVAKYLNKDVFDVTGAGDTVVSILSSYIIAGKSISSAVKMSNLAAGLSVQKLGSTSVTQSELLNESKK